MPRAQSRRWSAEVVVCEEDCDADRPEGCSSAGKLSSGCLRDGGGEPGACGRPEQGAPVPGGDVRPRFSASAAGDALANLEPLCSADRREGAPAESELVELGLRGRNSVAQAAKAIAAG